MGRWWDAGDRSDQNGHRRETPVPCRLVVPGPAVLDLIFYQILLDFIAFYRILSYFYWILSDFIGFYWILLDFIRFLLVACSRM